MYSQLLIYLLIEFLEYYIQIMWKINYLLIVLTLGSTVYAQTWQHDPGQIGFDAFEGAQLPNMYSTVIWAQNTDDVSDQYDRTIPENIIASTDKVYYAASLFELAFANVNDDDQKYLAVKDVTINAGRTLFTLKMSYHEKFLGSQDLTEYFKIGISVIIIGSSFQGEADYAESSFVYPRTGILRDVLYNNIDTPIAQFDFRTDSEKSPFDYLPGSQFSDKCGMIKATANSDRIIEVSGCGYFRFHTFVSGFTIEQTGNTQQLDLGARLVKNAGGGGATVSETDRPEVTGVDTIFKDDLDDTSVGLWISYLMDTNIASNTYYSATYKLLRIQLSFIFVGIRSFQDQFPLGITPSLNYPTQHVYRQDDFIYYGSVGHQNVNGPTVTLASQMYKDTPQSPQRITYAGTAGPGFGNAFCGVESIRMDADTAEVGFTIINPKEPTQITQNGANAGDQTNFGCLFFKRRNTCDGSATPLSPLPNTNGYTYANKNFDIQISVSSLTNGLPSYKFQLDQNSPPVLSKVTIKLFYNRAVTDAVAFKISIQVSHIASPPTNYEENIKITGFGHVLIDDTLSESSDYSKFGTGPGTNILEFYVYNADIADNEIIIEYSSTNHAIQFVAVSVEQYANLLNGIECVQSCPAAAAAFIGLKITTQPLSCQYCKQSEHKRPNFQTGGCKCVPGYYSTNQGACESCATGIDLCGTCSSASVCTSCTRNADASFSALDVLVDCKCKKGFFPSGGKCNACPFGCSQCISLESCTVCQDSTNSNQVVTRKKPKCDCIPGYFDDGDHICSTCSSRCLTCKNSASQCTSCDESKHFVKKDTACECRSGYYELNTGATISCQKCDLSCLQCSISSLYCEACNQDDFRRMAGRANGKKRCDCWDGYIEVQGTCVDKSCKSVDQFCQSCAFNPLTLASQCLSCRGNRYVLNGECVCKPGWYQRETGNTATCKRCALGCIQCVMKNDRPNGKPQCTKCAPRAVANDDGSCQCPQGTVIVEISNSLFCRACSRNCAACSGTPEYCTKCVPGFSLNGNNKCVCPIGTYPNPSNTNCVPCMANCKTCKREDNGPLVCETCATNYVFNGAQCTLSCPDGKYNSGSVCADCPTQCTSCISKDICLSCVDDKYLFAGCCRSDCPVGTVIVGRQCLACQAPCASCSGSPTSCDDCQEGYLLFYGKCVEDCPPSTYFGDSSCLACNPRCLTCEGTSTNCVSCAPSQYLYNNDCFTTCPAVVIDGKCTDICPDGKYYENSQCHDCDEQCMTCSGSSSNCNACAHGYISYAGSCIENCPKGTYQGGSTCIRCDISCQQCQESSIKCTICADGYIKEGSYCVEKCQQGFYKDHLGRCAKCGEGCQICSSLGSCSVCFDPKLTPTNGKCVKTCPPGAINNGERCICSFGVLHQLKCISHCPEGFFVWRNQCFACEYPCRTCSGAVDYCLSCIDGHDYDPINHSCVRKNNCPYGQVEHGSGCVNYCPYGTYLHKKACVYQCPVGYPHNGYGGCAESINPSVCPPGKYQQGSSCVNFCSDGYYANNIEFVCLRCQNGCKRCLSSTHCFDCQPSYALECHTCVPKMQCPSGYIQFQRKCYPECPLGTYPFGQSCKTICPEGTLFWDPYCYATCPTKYRTQFACLDECPSGYTANRNTCQCNW